MFVSIKCAFCGQLFDHDSSAGETNADCPHCGKRNSVALPGGAAKEMTIQHGAPTLAGSRPCPSCKTPVERDAVLCIHCGYNFASGKKVGAENWFAKNQKIALLAGGGLVVLGLGLAYVFWPETPAPPPYVPAAVPAPATAKPAADAAPVTATAQPAQPAQPVEPPPPPKPTPEELAAQQAEAERVAREAEEKRLAEERAAFEAKKIQAEMNLRQQLEVREPMHRLGENVELRRKNGVLHKGELQRFAGTGTGRVAVVATALGEIGVPLVELDPASRRRVDPDYREAFIGHLLSTRLPAAPGAAAPP
jgi:phage FluMu protein Com